jgi:hypothetical protein
MSATTTAPPQHDFYFVVDKIDVVPELKVRCEGGKGFGGLMQSPALAQMREERERGRGGGVRPCIVVLMAWIGGGGRTQERARQYEKNIRDANAKHVGQILGIHYTKITKDSVVRHAVPSPLRHRRPLHTV